MKGGSDQHIQLNKIKILLSLEEDYCMDFK